jgi:hypothetical protein
MQCVSYQRKLGDSFFPELLVTTCFMKTEATLTMLLWNHMKIFERFWTMTYFFLVHEIVQRITLRKIAALVCISYISLTYHKHLLVTYSRLSIAYLSYFREMRRLWKLCIHPPVVFSCTNWDLQARSSPMYPKESDCLTGMRRELSYYTQFSLQHLLRE